MDLTLGFQMFLEGIWLASRGEFGGIFPVSWGTADWCLGGSGRSWAGVRGVGLVSRGDFNLTGFSGV